MALRILASQGWLQRKIIKDGEEIDFQLTDKGRKSLTLAHQYDKFCHYLPTLINIEQYLFQKYDQEKEKYFLYLITELSNLKSLIATICCNPISSIALNISLIVPVTFDASPKSNI